ncbi:MAG: hypothetical protein WBW82_17695, partial [Candidatus Sulfotelmatobacter sp.]
IRDFLTKAGEVFQDVWHASILPQFGSPAAFFVHPFWGGQQTFSRDSHHRISPALSLDSK